MSPRSAGLPSGTAHRETNLAKLCADGFDALFALDFQALALQFQHIDAQVFSPAAPVRLKVLLAFLDPDNGGETFHHLYRHLIQEKDDEGAAAATIAAVISIMNSGCRFGRLDAWQARIVTIERSTSPQAIFMPAIMGAKGIIELILNGNPERAAACFLTGLSLVQQRTSRSQQFLLVLGACIAFFYQADNAKMEALLFDLLPIADQRSTPPMIKGGILLIKGMHRYLIGDVHASVMILFQILNAPQSDSLPACIGLFVNYQLLIAAIDADDTAAVQLAAYRLQKTAVLTRHEFIHGLAHFALGGQALKQGKAEAVLLHSKLSKQKADLCGSVLLTIHSDYLIGQALSDLRQFNEAIDIFDELLERAKALGLKRFEIGSAAELVNALIAVNGLDLARQQYECMMKAVTLQPRLPAIFRPSNLFFMNNASTAQSNTAASIGNG